MPGIVVRAGDAHRDRNERRLEELEREAARLAEAGGRLVAINDRLAARVEQADRLVALLGQIAALEDGTPEDWWRAIPLHGEVAAIVGAWMPLAETGGA